MLTTVQTRVEGSRSPPVFFASELARSPSPLFLLGSCFRLAELVDDEVVISLFDDSLELGVHVPAGDGEAIALAVDAVVVSNCERKQRLALGLAALAQHLDRVPTALAGVFGDVLDLPIHRAINRLVLRHSRLAGDHRFQTLHAPALSPASTPYSSNETIAFAFRVGWSKQTAQRIGAPSSSGRLSLTFPGTGRSSAKDTYRGAGEALRARYRRRQMSENLARSRSSALTTRTSSGFPCSRSTTSPCTSGKLTSDSVACGVCLPPLTHGREIRRIGPTGVGRREERE